MKNESSASVTLPCTSFEYEIVGVNGVPYLRTYEQPHFAICGPDISLAPFETRTDSAFFNGVRPKGTAPAPGKYEVRASVWKGIGVEVLESRAQTLLVLAN